MSITNNYPATRPTLLLDFARSKKLDPRITFTRASTGTYYNGDTEAKAEENLLLQSQTFNTTWLVVNSTVTVDSTAAPDGTSTADTITDNATLSGHDVVQPITISANTTYSYSIFVKAGTSNYCIVAVRDGATGNRYFGSVFDLSTVSASQTFNGTSGTLTSASITSAGNGWYRCSVIGSVSAVGSMRVSIGIASAASGNTISNFGALSYVGTGSTIYAWGAQLEQRSAVTSYTATTTQPITNYIPVLLTAQNNVARFDHNPVTEESLGLLIEEQRTNLVTYSDDFSNAAWTKAQSSITSNTIVAPGGTLTGDKLVENTAASAIHSVTGSASVVSGTIYTCSIFVKAAERTTCSVRFTAANSAFDFSQASFDLIAGTATNINCLSASIMPVGNGWFRCTASKAAIATATGVIAITSGTGSYTGDGYSGLYIWGAQLEAGSFPTSYIPTTSSQATRAADVASMTGSNFSSWYNPAEGTIVQSYVTPSTVGAPLSIDAGSANDRLAISQNTSNTSLRIRSIVGGVAQYDVAPATLAYPSFNTYSFAYKLNDLASSANNSAAATDSNGTVPVTDRIKIGTNVDSSAYLNGTIKRIAYYPVRCTNAQLQALTGS